MQKGAPGTERSPAALGFAIGFAALAALLAQLPSLGLPLDRDEGEYATLALAWSRSWGLPYLDLLQLKPPLVPWLYALAFQVWGEGPQAVRILALVWQTVAGMALAGLAWVLLRRGGLRAWPSAWAASAGALVAALASSHPVVQGLGANSEAFMGLFLLLALAVLALLPAGSARVWIGAGALVGLASLAKQSALPALGVLPLLFAEGWRGRSRSALLLLLGASIPWALATLAFAFLGGAPAAGALWAQCFGYGTRYALGSGPAWWGHALVAARHLIPALGALLALAALGPLLGPDRRAKAAALAGILVALLGAGLSGRFYPHYLQPLGLPLGLAAAFALAGAHGLLARSLTFGLLLAGLLSWSGAMRPLWASPPGAARSLALVGVESFGHAPEAAAIIRAMDPEGGRLFIWGSEAELFFLSGRRPATRFLYHYPFNGEAPPWPGGGEELLAALGNPAVGAVAICAPIQDAPEPLRAPLAAAIARNFPYRALPSPPGFQLAFRRPPPAQGVP